MVVAEAGGSYVYARRAFGPFAGFLAGWTLWLAEWTSLAVFPVAFVRYLSFFRPDLTPPEVVAIKVAMVGTLTAVNYFGARLSGRFNDLLTAVKLLPLLLLIAAGLAYLWLRPGTAAANLTPFAPAGLAGLGTALIQIFWAYAGFELAIIPAGEVRDARRVVPRAILTGIAIVTSFYLLTNFVILASVPSPVLARSAAPTTTAFEAIVAGLAPALAGAGAAFMTMGALLSVSGSDESGTLSLSRLGYAMAVDGYLPRPFARLHPRYKTPYVSLLFQNATVLAAAIVGSLGQLIAAAVFFLSVTYAIASLAALRFRRLFPEHRMRLPGAAAVPYLGLAGAAFLLSQQKAAPLAIGLGLLALAVPAYLFLAPREEVAHLARGLLAATGAEMERRRRVFLARLVPPGRNGR